MIRNLSFAVSALALIAGPTAALAETASFNLRLTVPVHCSVQHQAIGSGGASGGEFPLGQIREYCNSPRGYQLIVEYAPGSLRGATLSVGEDRVVLNGSGQAVLSTETGPRVRQRMVSATPGEQGFDTDQLQFHVRPA